MGYIIGNMLKETVYSDIIGLGNIVKDIVKETFYIDTMLSIGNSIGEYIVDGYYWGFSTCKCHKTTTDLVTCRLQLAEHLDEYYRWCDKKTDPISYYESYCSYQRIHLDDLMERLRLLEALRRFMEMDRTITELVIGIDYQNTGNGEKLFEIYQRLSKSDLFMKKG